MPSFPFQAVSVVVPLKSAMERMQKILFRPFNFAKWMAIGFCSWLAGLAGANLNFNQFHHGEKSHFGEMFAHSWIYIHQNLSWIIPLSIVFAIVGMALVVALLWLSSRGQFMFLHCVVLNRGEISLPWKKFSKEATSLWHLRLILCAFSLVNVLVFVGVIVWSLLRFPNLPPTLAFP